jgi:type I restriction enzyme M protein
MNAEIPKSSRPVPPERLYRHTMQWIAPSEKDADKAALEKRLWDAANQLWAGAGLKQSEYSEPVLGLIFLRFAEVRFSAQRAKLNIPSPCSSPTGRGKGEGAQLGRGAGGEGAVGRRRGNRAEDPTAYHADGILYLPAASRFDHLLNLPEGTNIGQTVNDAMRAIERDNPHMAGVLPKGYQIFDSRLLAELIKTVSTIPATLEGDAFGKIYEYFLGTFAMSEGQKGGEFYTPPSIVRLLVEVLEPYHGRILDLACGSGGMFVQSARFVSAHRKNPASELSIHGQERVDATVRLARMNLAVHGLEGEIKQGNAYYEDLHNAVGRFDYLLDNPPFNVSAVDKERLASDVGPGRRFPFGLPRTDNANYLWIQLFYSSLAPNGRAGFVMANSASDARSSEQEIRRQLIEARAVDVMVAVGPNMFYTVTLPCTLWFFDKGKAGKAESRKRADTVLFIDARHIYRQVDRAHREWTPAQIGFVGNIVRLYRGEELDYTLGGDEARAKIQEIFGNSSSKIHHPTFRDVPGLCKAASIQDIAAQGWSLNPGRYVGVAAGETVSDEDFKEQLETLNEELESLNAQARDLEQTIAGNVAEILEA